MVASLEVIGTYLFADVKYHVVYPAKHDHSVSISICRLFWAISINVFIRASIMIFITLVFVFYADTICLDSDVSYPVILFLTI